MLSKLTLDAKVHCFYRKQMYNAETIENVGKEKNKLKIRNLFL